MIQTSIFDLPAYSTLIREPQSLEDALKVVKENAETTWLSQAMSVIRELCETQEEFCADDIWDRLGATREPRALGAVLRMAAKRGWCKKTHVYLPSKRIECHGRPICLWQSRLFPSQL